MVVGGRAKVHVIENEQTLCHMASSLAGACRSRQSGGMIGDPFRRHECDGPPCAAA
jgi:hypothetical protein